MMRLVMEASGLSFWPSLSLVVFLVACGGMLAWIYRPGSGAVYRRLSDLALDRTPDSRTFQEDSHATQG